MCVKPDGSLTANALLILKVCSQGASIDDMARETDLRAFRIKASIRELTGAGLLDQEGDLYRLTATGEKVSQIQKD
jgi:predicted transcriptional regulator